MFISILVYLDNPAKIVSRSVIISWSKPNKSCKDSVKKYDKARENREITFFLSVRKHWNPDKILDISWLHTSFRILTFSQEKTANLYRIFIGSAKDLARKDQRFSLGTYHTNSFVRSIWYSLREISLQSDFEISFTFSSSFDHLQTSICYSLVEAVTKV